MLQTTKRPDSSISIIGAGIAGAWQALLFAQAGHAVTLHERGDAEMTDATSHWAGGMLAPYCEAEVSEPIISRLGLRSLDIWRRELPDTPFNGSLVVAHPRERNDFERFARMTEGHRRLDAASLAQLEPSLEGRFRDALFFPTEGHVEPRRVLPKLHERIRAAGGTIKFDSDVSAGDLDGIVIDCRGLSARDDQPDLRGVKGEMILIETDEVQLARPVRLIHPRWPLYVIPREDNLFMLGATSIEAEDTGVSGALGAGAARRGLCRASRLRRGPHRRIRLRPSSGFPRQSAADRHSRRQDQCERALPPRIPDRTCSGRTDARLYRARPDRQ
ncbi:glycine oxidase [Bradyrhizobium sp. LB7.1]